MCLFILLFSNTKTLFELKFCVCLWLLFELNFFLSENSLHNYISPLSDQERPPCVKYHLRVELVVSYS